VWRVQEVLDGVSSGVVEECCEILDRLINGYCAINDEWLPDSSETHDCRA
jgi:hypothetical protein